MTEIIVTRLLINTMPLSRLILINSKNFFTLRKKRICLIKTNNNLMKLLFLKSKTKKINFQLSRCFLKKKPTLLSTAKGNKISYNLSLRNVFRLLKEHNNNGFLQKIYKKNIKKYLTKNYDSSSNNNNGNKGKNSFITINKGISIRKNNHSEQKGILQEFKPYKHNSVSPLLTLSLIQRSLNLNLIAKKIKSEAKYLSSVFLKKNYFTKKNVHNNSVLQSLKGKAIAALRNKNKNSFKPYISRIPITFSSQSQYHASKLIQNILGLNTTINEAYSVASLAHRAQEDKRSDLIKLDRRLSHIQEIIEGFIQTKQAEMNNLTFNSFNEKRKKTYSDFL